MIDHLMALDPGGRGIAAFFVRGGATAAAQALGKSRRVLLTLGAEVVYVTDAVAVPPLQAALKVLGEPSTVETFHVAHGAGGGPAAGGARETARRLLAEHRPTHMVAIERPGRSRDGGYRSA